MPNAKVDGVCFSCPYVQDVERGDPFSSFVAIRANTDESLSS
jgi:hypothetical protein